MGEARRGEERSGGGAWSYEYTHTFMLYMHMHMHTADACECIRFSCARLSPPGEARRGTEGGEAWQAHACGHMHIHLAHLQVGHSALHNERVVDPKHIHLGEENSHPKREQAVRDACADVEEAHVEGKPSGVAEEKGRDVARAEPSV